MSSIFFYFSPFGQSKIMRDAIGFQKIQIPLTPFTKRESFHLDPLGEKMKKKKNKKGLPEIWEALDLKIGEYKFNDSLKGWPSFRL